MILTPEEDPMGLFSKDIKNLADLYKHGLQDIYYAENRILKSLPSMIENATNAELKRGLQQHMHETEGQVRRLEEVFELHGEKPSGTKCPAIDGILKEGEDLMGEIEDPGTLNVGIVASAQAVEHYEITRYGALIAWATELGHSKDATILTRTLQEEKAADKKLTGLAEARINPKSAPGGGSKTAVRSKPRTARRAAASPRKAAVKRKARRR
jgi:ferritin-like metal-binding protein YciE